jgi:putative restriction endonuclease
MKGYIGVTDGDWVSHLRATGQTEANFWLPSGNRRFGVLRPGEPFLFKTHAPANSIVGGGFFEHFTFLRASEAWDSMGPGNGVASLEELVARVRRYRRGEAEPDPIIGCILLGGLAFFDQAVRLAPPRSFVPNIVQGKGYELGVADADSEAERLFALLLAAEASGVAVDDGPVQQVAGEVFGESLLVPRRLGQGAFKALVLESYDRRCAVTGHKITPTLEAAHIKPVSRGGENRLDNGLLLRSDVHTMFDRGYLTVDVAHRLRVSPRLRDDFGNGEEFYAREGEVVRLPERASDRPAREFLEWHGDEVFRAS